MFRTFGSLRADVLANDKSTTANARLAQIDLALDQSIDDAVFAVHEYADIVQDAMRYFDGSRYDLQAWCVMPNHVHVVLVTHPEHLLGNIVKSWKHSAAWSINRARGTSGAVFALDYFDRYMRNLRQAEAAIHYVEVNPVKAGLCADEADWPWSFACYRARGWQPCHDRLPVFLS